MTVSPVASLSKLGGATVGFSMSGRAAFGIGTLSRVVSGLVAVAEVGVLTGSGRLVIWTGGLSEVGVRIRLPRSVAWMGGLAAATVRAAGLLTTGATGLTATGGVTGLVGLYDRNSAGRIEPGEFVRVRYSSGFTQ